MKKLPIQRGVPHESVQGNASKVVAPAAASGKASVTRPEKVFWPKDGYTKGDHAGRILSRDFEMDAAVSERSAGDAGAVSRRHRGQDVSIRRMRPDLRRRGFAPRRFIPRTRSARFCIFILDSEEALAYVANLAAITIHVWSSRIPHLERPDWLLFDSIPRARPRGTQSRLPARQPQWIREIGLEPCLKTSGQMGIHVVMGLAPKYTYEQAKMFSELVAQVVVNRIPKIATINRNPHSRNGRVYIDYLQLGHGKTIAAPFSVRPLAGAPVSAPMT